MTTRQSKLETDGIWEGIQRYRTLVNKQEFHLLPPGQHLIAQNIPGVQAKIQEMQEKVLSGRAGVHIEKWGLPILLLDADHQAAIALIACVNSAADNTILNMSLCVANQCYLEYKWGELRKSNPSFIRQAERYTKDWTPRKAKRLLKKANFYQKNEWPRDVRIKYGVALLKCVLGGCDLFKVDRETHKGKTIGVLRFSDETWNLINNLHSQAELWRPVLPPMVCPPKPWRGDTGEGGFLSIQEPLIKADYNTGSSVVSNNCAAIRALNYIQMTEWKLNHFVLDSLKKAWDSGGVIGDLPPKNNTPIPEPPKDLHGNIIQDKLPEWKRKAAMIHGKNHRTVSRRLGFVLKLAVAERYKEEGTLYLPHNFDWRGRVYPLTNHLHYQSDDSTRALFLFKHGKALGGPGFRELKIHIANCWGEDKVSYNDRVRWTEDHHEEIMRSASSPTNALDYPWWTEGDAPWSLLAAMREYYLAMQSGNPSEYVSHLPISIDGTCNGLQHYSALGRDVVGAAAVNLIPQDLPNDLYSLVMDKVIEQVNQDVRADIPEAKHWDGKITRKVCKRPSMTYAYGVTYYGIAQQLVMDGHCDELMGDPKKNSMYLAGVISEAIPKVIWSADKYMDWLQLVSGAVAKEDQSLKWTTPSGFQPVQRYTHQKSGRINTLLGRFVVNTPEPHRLDKGKQRRGLPPNFVHSLDAAHMSRVVCKLVESHNIVDLMMIHDSYGTHAADLATLRQVTKEEFYNMYQEDILGNFKAEVERRYDITLPDPPPAGDLDLACVLQSDYFFS